MTRLREFRERKGLSQDALARLIGTQQGQISRWEIEERSVPLRYVMPLAEQLGCDPAEVNPKAAALIRRQASRSAALGLTLEPGGYAHLRVDMTIPGDLASRIFGMLQGHYAP